MKYNDFQIMSPKTFDTLAKEYLQNRRQTEEKECICKKICLLNNSYSYLAKKGPRRSFFKAITELSTNSENNIIKQTQLEDRIFPLTYKNLLKSEANLILDIIKQLEYSTEKDILEERTQTLLKLLEFK